MPGTMENQQTLESLLSDKDLRVDFIFYVNKIHAQESLLFWMEVEIFKRIVDVDECSKQAKLLYFRYLHTSSKSEINVEGKLKAELEKIMDSGIWDQTLYNAIQESVHECLKYSVVRSFMEYLAKQRKTHLDPRPMTPTHVILERYDGMLHKHGGGKDYGTLSRRPPKALRWIQKKTHSAITSITSDQPTKKEKEKDEKKLLGKGGKSPRRDAKPSAGDALDVGEAEEDEPEDIATLEKKATVHRERLTQQRLQQQIQLLRNLHQYQQDKRIMNEAEHLNPWEHSSPNSSPLSKSISMPVIAHRHSNLHLG